MATDIIKEIEQEYLKTDLPDIYPGDTVKVMVRIKEGNKERLQGYEGVVIRITGSGVSETITVRRVFQGVGVERVFLLNSPKVESIRVLRRGDVRRSRLYYMRGRSGKAARIREKIGAVLPEAGKKSKRQQKVEASAAQLAEKNAEKTKAQEAQVAVEEEQPLPTAEEMPKPAEQAVVEEANQPEVAEAATEAMEEIKEELNAAEEKASEESAEEEKKED